MSDPAAHRPSSKPPTAPHPPEPSDGTGGPHIPFPSPPASASANEPAPPLSISAEPEPPRARPGNILRKEHELLVEASRVAEHLRGHFDELDHREAQIHQQRDLLQQQRQHIQESANQLERQLSRRTADLKKREEGFRRQMEECEQLICDLEEQQRILGRARTEFEEEKARLHRDLQTERTNLRQDIEAELAEDFQKLKRAEGELAEERRRFAEEVEQHRRDHQAALEEVDQQLEFERAKLLEAVRAELDAERQHIAQERLAWEESRAEQEAALEPGPLGTRSRNPTATGRLGSGPNVFGNRMRRAASRMGQHCRQQAEEHAQQVAAWEAHRDEEQTALQEAREADDLPARSSNSNSVPGGSNSNTTTPPRSSDFRKNGPRGKIGSASNGSIWKSSVWSWRAFQREFQIEKQQTSQAQIRESELLRLRKLQLDEHRERLAAREASFDRERETLQHSQTEFAAELEADRARLRDDRLRWEQERDALKAELEHQSARLAELDENLTARSARSGGDAVRDGRHASAIVGNPVGHRRGLGRLRQSRRLGNRRTRRGGSPQSGQRTNRRPALRNREKTQRTGGGNPTTPNPAIRLRDRTPNPGRLDDRTR